MSPFIFKLIIIGLLLFILVNLAKALIIMVKEDGSKPMTRYLADVFCSLPLLSCSLFSLSNWVG
ncbi:hypothetical protein JCM19236_6250 [Vibrio sp. JCM 19236]|nr:hypothetical protein JCM19236_6250 [Vibrio sp. JCM 19236]